MTKRAVLFAALVAFPTAPLPVAAQWLGMPVWNSPKGGTGITINGDYGKPNSDGGKGNAWAGRAALGLGNLTVTAGVGTWKPGGATESFTAFGGDLAFRVIGGSLLPIALNVQGGAARSDSANLTPATTNLTASLGLAVSLPTPGFDIEPYVSPGFRWHKVSGLSGTESNFGYAVGVNVGFGLFGVHAAYDYEKRDSGAKQGVFGVGAHIGLRAPMGM